MLDWLNFIFHTDIVAFSRSERASVIIIMTFSMLYELIMALSFKYLWKKSREALGVKS